MLFHTIYLCVYLFIRTLISCLVAGGHLSDVRNILDDIPYNTSLPTYHTDRKEGMMLAFSLLREINSWNNLVMVKTPSAALNYIIKKGVYME